MKSRILASSTKQNINPKHEVLFENLPMPKCIVEKIEICKGNAPLRLKAYIERNLHKVIAFTYFDFYAPKVKCLNMIKPHIVRDYIIGFDEQNDQEFPSEALGFQKAFKRNHVRLHRSCFRQCNLISK